ncbi:MAG TPA: NAD-dependent epimerase/dehydratase family protein [Candidatus Nanoarchaeia archaeon]|nr:NAD-dependent epimerase/dehydratase family protein [Candidatus Nanoarchaeia archaeon]
MKRRNILVLGGAGYIGCHTTLLLLQKGHHVTVIDIVDDPAYNGRRGALKAVEQLSGIHLGSEEFMFFAGNLQHTHFRSIKDSKQYLLADIIKQRKIDSCIDFAAFIEAGTSMMRPEDYLQNNSITFIRIVPELYAAGVSTIVKSSTAAVYGALHVNSGFSEEAVLTNNTESALAAAKTQGGRKEGESLHRYLLHIIKRNIASNQDLWDHILSPSSLTRLRQPVNVYGWTKALNEICLEFFSKKFSKNCCILRYFNVWGVHPSTKLLEAHTPETHLIPKAMDCIARGKHTEHTLRKGDFLLLFGINYPTEDGTCVRDYIHVMDLAHAHLKALQAVGTFNLSLGHGYSNMEILTYVTSAVEARLIHLDKKDEGEKYKVKYKSNAPYELKLLDKQWGSEKALFVIDWEKRIGDPPELIANSSKAAEELGWKAFHKPTDVNCMKEVFLSRQSNGY